MGTRKGIADYILLIQGKAFFVEIKTLKGKLSQSQKNFAEEATEKGYKYLIARSLDNFIEIFEECLNEVKTIKYKACTKRTSLKYHLHVK